MRDFAVPDARRFDGVPQGAPGRRDLRTVIGDLFPEPEVTPPRSSARRLLSVVAQVVAVGAGAIVLLERIPGLPAWDTIYAEDYWKFLTQALQQPWHLYIPFGGYEELLPRVIAQFATYLPLTQASRWFAVCGALIAAGCGLFVFHASAGHIRSLPLRALLGTAVVLLPIAPMEIADSGVCTPWYLMLVTLWAMVWRPRSRRGMAVAALVVFGAASGEVITALFAPLVVARLYVLRSPREHVVSAAWLAGCLLQVPAVVYGYTSHTTRLGRGLGSLSSSLAFYAHDSLLPSFGWHLAWRLQSFAGRNWATLIAAAVLAVILGAIFVTQPSNRLFVVTAAATGLVFSVFGTTLSPYLTTRPVSPVIEPGARYSAMPIFLFESAAVVGVDYLLRRRGDVNRHRRIRLRPAMAVSALVAVLAASWVADFRYPGYRSIQARNWAPIVAKWQHDCEHSKSGQIVEKAGATFQTLPCDRIHP